MIGIFKVYKWTVPVAIGLIAIGAVLLILNETMSTGFVIFPIGLIIVGIVTFVQMFFRYRQLVKRENK